MLTLLAEAAAKTISEGPGTVGNGGPEDDQAFSVQQAWETIQEKAIELAPSILAALGILIAGYFLSKIVASLLKRGMIKAKIDKTIASFASKLAYIALIAFVGIAALSKLGVETGSFIAIIGAAGLAVGFALQGSLSNFAAGVMIIIFRPFKIGDVVEVAGEIGSIKEIEVFATTLLRPDNKLVIIPNSSIMGGNISNYSAEKVLRVDLTAGIGYGDDIKKAKELLEKICADHPKVLSEPAPLVAVSELADSSVNFVVRPWAETADYWAVYFDITESIKLEMDKAGISIPFPQQDVHMHQVA